MAFSPHPSDALSNGSYASPFASGGLHSSGMIIVSDSSAEMMTLYQQVLERKGRYPHIRYIPESAEVVRVARSEPVTLIISDISKPGMDGFEMLRALRENPATKRVPVIFATTRTDVFSRRKAFELGVSDYLPKPFSAQMLLEKVHQFIGII